MIIIDERVADKVTGETSLFISFHYNKDIVEFIKTLSGNYYHRGAKEWELPLPYLSAVIDELCVYDKIELNLLEQKSTDIEYSEIQLDDYKYPPFKYQEEGIKYGLTHDKWLLLFDMGLGKTLVITYLANELKRRGKIDHCLIICGVNSLKNNWRKEIQKFTDISCTILGERITKRGNRVIGTIKERAAQLMKPIDEFFVITNIETIRSKEVVEAILRGPNRFDMIAVDEIHKCGGGPSTQQAQGLKKLSGAKYKIGATGTLITNDPLNAYNPLQWVDAEHGNYTQFKQFYCDFFDANQTMVRNVKNLDYLQHIINRNSLRKTKDILDLPPKTIINEYVDMTDAQTKFYEDVKNGVKESVDKVILSTGNILAMVSRLRQATACPSVLATTNVGSAKVDRAVDLTTQLVNNGDKVVIFSTFKETVYNLADLLCNYNPLVATGDMKDSDVSANIDKFQNDANSKLLIGTWQKCGTGFTLTASRYMIFVDIPFTNASYEQAQDRIYRIGTKEPVFIYHLITTGTIDERVLQIVERKEALGDYLVDGEISNSSLEMLKEFLTEL